MKKTYIAFIACIMALAALLTACTVTKLVETPPGSGQYKPTAETDPRFTKGLETAEGVAGVFGPINPWHGLVTILFGGAAAIAEWNKRRKQAQLDAVITGVEAADSGAVKKAIYDAAVAAKVEPALNKTVKNLTGSGG